MLRHSLDELLMALHTAAALLTRPLATVDDDEFTDVLGVLACFASVPGFEPRYDWLAGCHLTDDERRSTRRLAIEVAVRRDAARAYADRGHQGSE